MEQCSLDTEKPGADTPDSSTAPFLHLVCLPVHTKLALTGTVDWKYVEIYLKGDDQSDNEGP